MALSDKRPRLMSRSGWWGWVLERVSQSRARQHCTFEVADLIAVADHMYVVALAFERVREFQVRNRAGRDQDLARLYQLGLPAAGPRRDLP